MCHRRRVLIALNAEPELPRPAACTLARRLDLWWADGTVSLQPELAARLGLTPALVETAQGVCRAAGRLAAGQERRAAECGARIVTLVDPDYPRELLDLELPPPALYLRGALSASPAVAIVGSRAADPYGLEVSRLFGRELAMHGACVVSGFARGVDTAAHEGALDAANGSTVAVLGCGIDLDYPRGSRKRAARIAERGAVVSEFAMATPPWPQHFPIRNRIIAALAAGCLVVRAAPRSGSLITARLALELGRDVYAIPGRIFDDRAWGTNTLIRDGAYLVQHPREVLETLPDRLRQKLLPLDERETAPPPLPKPQLAVWQALEPGEPLSPERVAERCGRPIDRVLALLLELELGGWVRRYPGPAYVRRGD